LVGDEGIARIEPDARERGDVASPDLATARRFVAADPALVGRGTHFATMNCRVAHHIGHPLEIGAALGYRHRRLPAHTTGSELHRDELAAREAGERELALDHHARRRADYERGG